MKFYFFAVMLTGCFSCQPAQDSVAEKPAVAAPVKVAVNESSPMQDTLSKSHFSKTESTLPVKSAAQRRDTLPPKIRQDFSLEYLMGKFDPAKHPDFMQVDKKYADAEGYFLRRDAYEQFRKMWEAAKKDGITLKIVSATRTFYRQKQIWEGKWTGTRTIENGANAAKKYPKAKTRALKILEYSSMPGASRHHWGTDIDLNDLDNYAFEQGPGKKVYDWLKKNAAGYGFCQPYTAKGKDRSTGYNEEKWHWSYMPVARQLTELAHRSFTDELIGGFLGAETAVEIGIVKNYVLGVNLACL